MDYLFTTLLILHIISGILALVTGSIAIFTRKGGKPHKKGGRIYYLSMLGVAFTALTMSAWKDNQFLLAVGIFSLYMAYTGNRAVKRRKDEGRIHQILDDVLLVGAFLGGGWLLYLGGPTLWQGYFGMNIVSVVFGLFTAGMAVEDLGRRFSDRRFDKKANLLLHISRMGGAFIATFTAFLVTNVYIEPFWMVWLAPTVVGSTLMAIATRKWRKKLYPKGRKKALAAKTIPSQAG